jgi:methionine synthase I (cobalamin-dependent)
MASKVPELIKAGAQIIGGCCGTTPEHIAAMARVAKAGVQVHS